MTILAWDGLPGLAGQFARSHVEKKETERDSVNVLDCLNFAKVNHRKATLASSEFAQNGPTGSAGIRVLPFAIAENKNVTEFATESANAKESLWILKFAILSVVLLGQNGAITELARPLVELENDFEKDRATVLVLAAEMTLKSATVATASVLTGPNGQRGPIAQSPAEKV